jgi:hypothetical protein
MAGWSGLKWSNLIGSLGSRNPAVWTGLPDRFFLSVNFFLAILINILLTELVHSG